MTPYSTRTRTVPARTDLDALAASWQRDPRDETATALWLGLRAVVRRLVKRRQHIIDSDDLYGIAGLALMQALRSWVPGRGYSFRSWAALNVKGQFRNVINATIYQWRCARSVDATAPVSSPDPLVYVIAKHEREERRKVVAEAKSELTPGQWAAIEGRLIRGLTLEQIAAETGSSRQAVHARQKKALPYLSERLRARLGGVI